MTDFIADAETLRRWRLILGAEAEPALTPEGLADQDRRRDSALGFLYEREHEAHEELSTRRQGGQGAPRPTPVRWLGEVRRLFPRSAAEVLQRDALDRYQLHALLSDPAVLARATPSLELVQTLLLVRAALPPAALSEARRIIGRVVEELEARLSPRLQAVFAAHRRRLGNGGRPRLADLNWSRTLRHNLRNYQPASGELVLERLFFYPRQERRLPWHLHVLVDQSGSMAEAVIHSAVIAAIFARLRALRTRLALFSDEVVDLSAQLHDPVQLLLGAQLGGGTNIGAALADVRLRLEEPRRTVVVLISDLYEGYSPDRALTEAAHLCGAGVRLLALTALDRRSNPDYDREFAQKLRQLGAEVAALTPDRLADWLAKAVVPR